jgi:hydrogenase maturation protease
MNQKNDKQIVVMGVGNALLMDEGVGIRVVQELYARYDFPANVKLVDGGVLGLSLTGVMIEADQVIVIDAVRGGDEPGTIYRFTWEAKPSHIQYKDSLHQIDLMETMGYLPLIGRVPEVLVVGVEYENIFDWGTELTPKVEAAVPALVELVVAELGKLGAEAIPKAEPQKVRDVLSSTG